MNRLEAFTTGAVLVASWIIVLTLPSILIVLYRILEKLA